MKLALKQTYVSCYFATTDGDIYSDKSGKLRKIRSSKDRSGYLMINGGTTSYKVHRLVASAFLGDITNLTINHLNGIKSDNRVVNLEIVTMKQNIDHAWETGLSKKGEQHGKCLYSDELLLTALQEIKDGLSVNKTAKKYQISQSYLNKVKNGIYRSDLKNKIFV